MQHSCPHADRRIRVSEETVSHTGPLWRWTANNGVSWFFITIDGEAGEAISATALMRRLELGSKRGWGGVRVSVTLGESKWQTSVFPQKDEAGWLLPVKAAIRKAEGLEEGSEARVTLSY